MLLIAVTLALVATLVALRLPTGNAESAAPAPTPPTGSPTARSGAGTPSAVRGTTTPAPSGPASAGSAPAHPTGTIHVVGFGDSVMYGAGCACDDFLTQTGRLLQQTTGRQVSVANNGANGQTAAGVLADLRTDDAATAEVGQADVIVLTIGANDLGPVLGNWVDDDCDRSCYHPEVEQMDDRLSAILAIIDREKKPAAAVFVLDYWNVFEDGEVGADDYDQGYLAWSDQVTRDANAAICQAAGAAGATCVDTYRPFKGAEGATDPTHLLADDGDHPNDAGTALIATALATAVERQGVVG